MSSGRRLQDEEVVARKRNSAARQFARQRVVARNDIPAQQITEYFWEPCTTQPWTSGLFSGFLPTGLTGSQAIVYLGGESCMMNYIGTATTRFGPTGSSIGHGLTMSLDVASGEGCEYVLAHHTSASEGPHTNVIGYTQASFTRCVMSSAVVATADISFGFRANEAFQAAVDDYQDLAAINIAAPGEIDVETIVGGAATANLPTGLALANNDLTEFLVICDTDGKVKFYVNGDEYGGGGYQFTEGLAVNPFLFVLGNGGVTTCVIESWEAGPVSYLSRGL